MLRLLAAGLCSAWLGACSTATPAAPALPKPPRAPEPTPVEPLPADDGSVELQRLVQSLATKHRICQVAVAVVQDWMLQSVGAASGCGSGAGATADAVFQAASLSKPVFAYAVIKLVQQGRLDLDAPLARYLPAGHPAGARGTALSRVSARMVLNHSSGLQNEPAAGLVLSFEPGKAWQYSGQGYALLQRAVEQVTGTPLQTAVRQLVFQPLGMDSSSFVWQSRFQAHAVAGHAANGVAYPMRRFTVAHAAATLYTSAADYGRFLAAVLNDPEMLRTITERPVPVEPALNLRWGQGWGLEQHGRETALWQWGNNPGYKAFVLAAPGRGTGFVMLTNSDDGLRLAKAMAAAVLPGQWRLFDFRMMR